MPIPSSGAAERNRSDPEPVGETGVIEATRAAETVRPRQAPIDAFARGDYADAFPGAQYHNKAWVLEPGRTMAMLGIHGQFCLLDLQAQLLLVSYASYLAQADEVMIASTLVFWEAVREAVSVSGGRT